MMLQMSNMMRGGGQQGAFPAPGLPSTAANQDAGAPAAGGAPAAAPAQPFFNPWFPPPPASGSNPASPGATGAGAPPFGAFDPAMMQQMMGAFGGAGPMGGFGGAAAPAAPADTRPPEERFQVQLQVCRSDPQVQCTV